MNLDLESHAAYEWLQTPKGLKKKVLRGFWTRWLNNSRASPTRASPASTIANNATWPTIQQLTDLEWRKEHGKEHGLD